MTERVLLRTATNHYVGAQAGGGQGLVAVRQEPGPWEVFEVVKRPDNKVALRAASGQYVCATGGGGSTVVADRASAGPWETFEFRNVGEGTHAFLSHNGHFLCAEGGGGREVVANRKTVGPWETFAVEAAGQIDEPSLLYGYVTLVDPDTGKPHLPISRLQAHTVLGYPAWMDVTFRATSGTETSKVRMGAGAPFIRFGLDHHMRPSPAADVADSIGWFYAVTLLDDPAEEGPPARYVDAAVRVGPFPARNGIRYNARRWSFQSVAVGDCEFEEPEGSGTRVRVALRPRDLPFPDWPNV